MKTDVAAKDGGPCASPTLGTQGKGQAPARDGANRKAGGKKPTARRAKAIDERQLSFFDLF